MPGVINDPIGDMLTRVRNAGLARLAETSMPKTSSGPPFRSMDRPRPLKPTRPFSKMSDPARER